MACFLIIGLFAGVSNAQVSCVPNEQGSLLVFPLIDNINYTTYVDITNRASTDVWLQGIFVVHTDVDPYTFVKKDFIIHLTQKEPFLWNTAMPYVRQDVHGVWTQIPSFDNHKGFMFVWAVNDAMEQLEIDWNYLMGDAMVLGGGHSFQYNAYPHQVIAITPDRLLDIDGVEYCAAPSQIMVQGIAGNYVAGLGGKLVVCNIDIDLINSIQPSFDINFAVWNQFEHMQSRHLHFTQFEQYDIIDDLQLGIDTIFTAKWQLATTSTHPLWAIFYQHVGTFGWGTNVWQEPASIVATQVVLAPVPTR
jgi:hypothetical protein